MNSYMNPTEIRDALIYLGSTPNEVAATLIRGGHKGTRKDVCNCPIAVFVRYLTGEWDVAVRIDSVTVSGAEVLLPIPVKDFIACFDSSFDLFPELDRNG